MWRLVNFNREACQRIKSWIGIIASLFVRSKSFICLLYCDNATRYVTLKITTTFWNAPILIIDHDYLQTRSDGIKIHFTFYNTIVTNVCELCRSFCKMSGSNKYEVRMCRKIGLLATVNWYLLGLFSTLTRKDFNIVSCESWKGKIFVITIQKIKGGTC